MKNFIRIRVISIIILFAFMFSIASVGAESITYGKRNVYAMEENGGLEPQEGEEDENSSKIPETLTPVNEEQETNGEIAEPDEEQESNSGESGLVDEEVVPEDEEKSDVQDEEQDNEQNDAQNDGQNDEQNNEIVVPLESLPDSSKDLILPSASLTENAGIRFFGFQYIHVNQSCTDLYEQYIQFEESITGKVHIRLLDDEGNTVAISDEYELINSTSFYSVLYKIRYFTEGKYYLEVIKDGDSLNGESLYEVTVTDSPILTGVYTSPLDGKQPVTGSTELHFQVDAYGVDNPEDLVITILEPDGNNGYIEIGQSVQGRIEQKFYTGKVTLKYKVKLKDNEFLKDEYGYKVKINRNDGEELFSIANIIDVYTDKYPYIYNINIIDGAAGKVILKTQNISNGEYRVVFNKLGNGWQVVDTVEDASSYCNLGVLEVQLMDDGIPAYLEGRYNIEILDGEEFVSSSHISINYSSEYFSDYYSGPAILDVTPSYVKGTAEEQIVQVAAKMINITPENAKIELIEVDKDGKFLAVAGSIDDLNFIKLSEPHGYKFDNMYTVRGGISLSGLDTSKQYRWRISFKDRNNGDRIIVYSNPVKISQVAIADKLRMINVKAVAQQQEMHETGGQFMYPSMYLIAAGTDKIDFAIDSAFNMEDISKINVQLKDSTGTVYGNLKANSLIVQGTMIEGSVNVVVPLSNKNQYYFIVFYDGVEAGRLTTIATTSESVFAIPVIEYGNPVYSAGNSFSFEMVDTFNIDLSQISVHLTPIDGSESITPGIYAVNAGSGIIVSCTSNTRLTGFYKLSVKYKGQPVKRGYFDSINFEVNDFDTYQDGVVYFTDNAFVDNVYYADKNYSFVGGKFSPSKNYKVALFKRNSLEAKPDIFDAVYESESKLALTSETVKNYPKGYYGAYILEDGNIVPGTFGLELLLEAEENIVIQPIVTINNGSENTISKNIVINIRAGTFTQVRIANYPDELANTQYRNVSNEVPYTLSDGFGPKTIYLQFKDPNGLETEVLTANINYISSTLPAPDEYGISDTTLKEGQVVTLWLKSSYVPAIAVAEFYDNKGALIKTLNLPRTMTQLGVNTYSKAFSVEKELADVEKVLLYVKNALTGDISPASEIELKFEDIITISNVYTIFDMLYSNVVYLRRECAVSLNLAGTPEMEATAELIYTTTETGAEISSEPVALSESFFGRYYANTTLPSDVAELKSIKYTLKSKLTGASQEYTEIKNIPVSSSISFTSVSKVDGEYDYGAYNGMTIVLTNMDPSAYYYTYLSISDGQELKLNSIPKGKYSYRLTDWNRNYISGEVDLAPGKEVTVELTNISVPSELVLNIPNASTRGIIEYTINIGGNTSDARYVYQGIGKPLKGLAVGDTVTYKVHLDYVDLSKYKKSDDLSGTIEIDKPLVEKEISLEEYEKVELTGRVINTAVGDETNILAIEGAVVYFSQNIILEDMYLYENATVVTDENGEFSVSAYIGFSGQLSISKTGYESKTVLLSEEKTSSDGELGNYNLSYLDTGVINVSLLAAAASLNGEPPVFIPAPANKLSNVIAKKDGKILSGYYSSYQGKFYLTDYETLKSGDKITLEARSIELELNTESEKQEVTLDRYLGANIEFSGIEYGYITVSSPAVSDTNINASGNITRHMFVFGEDGTKKAYVSGTGTLKTNEYRLEAGKYSVILLSGENLSKISRIYRITDLSDLNLVEDTHYVKRAIEFSYGQIIDLGEISVPVITNEELGYLSNEGTSITAKVLDVTEKGEIRAAVTVKCSIADRFASEIVKINRMNINIIKNDNSNITIENGEYYLNGKKYTTSYEDSINISNYQDTLSRGVVTFNVLLQGESILALDSQASVSIGGRTINESLGSINLYLPAVSINAPEEVLTGDNVKIRVKGTGFSGKEVEILDNDIVVGKAVVNARGSWEARIQLIDGKNPGIHYLNARVMDEDKGEYIVSNTAYTQIISGSSPHVADITVNQPGLFAIRIEDASESLLSSALSINPNHPIYASFKIIGAEPEDVDFAGLVNENGGVTALLPASYNPETGYWELTGYLNNPYPGELSLLFTLKDNFDISYLTGSTPIDVTDLPDNAKVDPASLPQAIREGTVEVTEDGKDSDRISATMTLEGTGTITLTGEHTVVNTVPTGTKFIRLQTNQGAYYTSAPTVTILSNGDIEIRKTVYFERDLYNSIMGDTVASAETKKNSDINALNMVSANIASTSEEPLLNMMNQQYLASTSTTQSVLDKMDYVSYVSGVTDFVVSTSQNPNALGKLGTGMTVFGGITLVGQITMGRIGTDPAELRKAASLIESDSERNLIYNFINEYAQATKNSHYINCFMGGVSYGASFFGPVGKGLSYIVSSGGQVFGKKVGDEYELWADSILSMIRSALEKQEREKNKLGKKKKIADPKWKIDPSGYVFEATESERIEGVTATALIKDGNSFRIWSEAEEWDEVNPVTTDEEGKYGWDVPEGEWKVRFEKEGYQTYETKAMAVPPLHDQVNIGLMSNKAPGIAKVQIYPDGLEIEFDIYMRPDSIMYTKNGNTINNILVKDSDGNIVKCKEIVMIDKVDNTGYTGTGDYSDIIIPSAEFVKKVRFVPYLPAGGFNLYGDDGETAAKYNVTILPNVSSYAGAPMSTQWTQDVNVQERIITRNITKVTNPAAKTVSYGTPYSAINLPSTVEVTLDDNTVINLNVTWNQGSYNANLSGTYTITGNIVLVDGITNTSNIIANVIINVAQAPQIPGGDDSNNTGGSGSQNGNIPQTPGTGKTDTTDTKDTSDKETEAEPEPLKIRLIQEDNTTTALISGSPMTDNGKAEISISDGQMEALQSELEKIKSDFIMDIFVETASDIKEVLVQISANAFEMIAESKSNGVRISTSVGTITFDKNATESINSKADNDINIKIAIVDTSELSGDLRKTIGDKPVLSLSIEAGNKDITSFNGGTAYIEIPYTLKYGEDSSSIVIYYIDNEGNLNTIKASGYDSERKVAKFAVSHFSMYAVGYNPVDFNDINMWAQNSIKYLAARGIVSGIGNGSFEPYRNVTRAEFVKMLVGALDDIELNTSGKSVFVDVPSGMWYTPYIIWAAENKVVNGYGNGYFGPSDVIQREQMAVMLSNFIKAIGLELPQEKEEQVFNDQDQISAWARDAVKTIQKAGIINGKPGNIFDPKGNATRAEAAKVIEYVVKYLYMVE